MEVRQIWLVTESGAPKYCSWGRYKNPSSEADTGVRDWASALDDAQEADVNFDGTQTTWRRAPAFGGPGVMDHANANSSLVGRTLRVGGVTWDLDDTGRAQAVGQENHEPDGTVVDLTEAVVLAEGLAGVLKFVEATTLKKVLVEFTSQIDAYACPTGYDSVIFRKTSDSLVIRTEAV